MLEQKSACQIKWTLQFFKLLLLAHRPLYTKSSNAWISIYNDQLGFRRKCLNLKAWSTKPIVSTYSMENSDVLGFSVTQSTNKNELPGQTDRQGSYNTLWPSQGVYQIPFKQEMNEVAMKSSVHLKQKKMRIGMCKIPPIGKRCQPQHMYNRYCEQQYFSTACRPSAVSIQLWKTP